MIDLKDNKDFIRLCIKSYCNHEDYEYLMGILANNYATLVRYFIEEELDKFDPNNFTQEDLKNYKKNQLVYSKMMEIIEKQLENEC